MTDRTFRHPALFVVAFAIATGATGDDRFASLLGDGDPGSPGGDSCPGDVTGNGTVNPIDLAALLVGWGTDGNGEFDTDCNDDGIVDSQDLAIVLAGWGTCP